MIIDDYLKSNLKIVLKLRSQMIFSKQMLPYVLRYRPDLFYQNVKKKKKKKKLGGVLGVV